MCSLHRIVLSAAIVGGASLSFGCHGNDSSGSMDKDMPMQTSQSSLYTQLGGEKAIHAVVDDFVPRVASDSRVNFTREGTSHPWNASPENVEHLKMHLVAFFTQATGGPANYHGKSMEEAHRGMQISEDQLGAFVEDFKATLNHLNVPQNLQDQLIAKIAPTHDQIVGH